MTPAPLHKMGEQLCYFSERRKGTQLDWGSRRPQHRVLHSAAKGLGRGGDVDVNAHVLNLSDWDETGKHF